ncbi:MAG: hypothetical protein ABSC61_08255 [Anaerolineales bacterium]
MEFLKRFTGVDRRLIVLEGDKNGKRMDAAVQTMTWKSIRLMDRLRVFYDGDGRTSGIRL